jgi:hypothetical protein
MQLEFTLADISGKKLSERFKTAITEEDVGWEKLNKGTLQAELTVDDDDESRPVWKTVTSGFSYTIMNPDDTQPAKVLYQGAVRGFLMQSLIPEELKGRTAFAKITEGSVFNHEKFELVNTDAEVLSGIYAIIQKTQRPIAHVVAASSIVKSLKVMHLITKLPSRAGLNRFGDPALILILATPDDVEIVISPRIGYGDPDATDEELTGAATADLLHRTAKVVNMLAPRE